MLAITANWGIGDGSLVDSRAGRAAVWLDAIRRAVARSGWGRDGRYRPVEHVTLVFAGDTFDWLLSQQWAGRDRPWHGGGRAEEARARVVAATARASRPLLRTVAGWARLGLPVAVATPRGRPSEWAEQRVMIQTVLLAGDRDPWLTDHAAAAARFGIATGEEWCDGERHVRHGHDLDPLAHRGPAAAGRGRRQPTLAESLRCDLLVRFATAARGDTQLWQAVRPRLAAVSAARPSQWPALISGMTGQDRGREAVWPPWRRAVAAWHAAAVRELPTCETEFDALGELAAWLDGDRGETPVPDAIRRLDGPTSSRPAAVIVPGSAQPDSPSLVCHDTDGHAWVEPLGMAPPAPPVVAIGAGAAGTGFIDAA
jgi:hypothetical protein